MPMPIYPRRLPGGPIRGMNLAPPIGTDTLTWWGNFGWDVPNGFKRQIDSAAANGCNMIRALCDISMGLWSGPTYTPPIATRIGQVARYCEQKGLWFYGTLGGRAAPQATGQAAIFAGIAANVTTYCQALASCNNVFAIDLEQEFYDIIANGLGLPDNSTFPMTVAQLRTLQAQLMAAALAVNPKWALTCSFIPRAYDDSIWSDAQVAQFADQFDFLDFHVYHDPAPGGSQAVYSQAGCPGKQILIGESGQTMSAGSAARLSRVTSVHNNVVAASYPGQPGCVGVCYWACIPQSATSTDDWGMFDTSDVARTDISTTYSTYPAVTTTFPAI